MGFGFMDIPRIDFDLLPSEEHLTAHRLETNLCTLVRIAAEFRCSVNLYLFGKNKLPGMRAQFGSNIGDLPGFAEIATRNGAILAGGFAHVRIAIDNCRAPTLWAKSNIDQRKEGKRLFVTEFPNIIDVRDAAAHPGEFIKNNWEAEKHGLKDRTEIGSISLGPTSYMEGMMSLQADHAIFYATTRGSIASYELSMRKADVLDTVIEHYIAAICPIAVRYGFDQQ